VAEREVRPQEKQSFILDGSGKATNQNHAGLLRNKGREEKKTMEFDTHMLCLPPAALAHPTKVSSNLLHPYEARKRGQEPTKMCKLERGAGSGKRVQRDRKKQGGRESSFSANRLGI